MNGTEGERSEAEGVSQAVVATLARGKVLKADARTRSARRRSVSSSAAPEPEGVKRKC